MLKIHDSYNYPSFLGQSWFQMFCCIFRSCVPIWNSKMWSPRISLQRLKEALFFQVLRHKTASTPYILHSNLLILVRDIFGRPKADSHPWRTGRVVAREEAWSWTQKHPVNKVLSFPWKYTQWMDKLEDRVGESFHQVWSFFSSSVWRFCFN